ncbi:AAA family ATPase [Umezawaea endophytica]|uniref:AAA family ATPase n=1 Tax=Umezawaea endophytica TaxID=1654476 RepID=A0A9X2VQP5_9PSEU|nr:ATP-binding protein [Umezawaea endophytica]MCS7480965.1 AAA family ATPase [Umezawaea endophytica]
MLTRLEVDGFKNLVDTKIDFGAFTCIAGENGTGKSNVFDAIRFLSLLADRSLLDAAQEVRGVHGERTGDPRDLFWNGYAALNPRVRFAAEMIVPSEVEDDFGRPTTPTITFLRYELSLGYQAPRGSEKIGRLTLLEESLQHINLGDAPRRIPFPHNVNRFRKTVLKGHRSGKAFISTTIEDNQPVIRIHQDGGSRGQPKPSAAYRAPATVVSTVTSADDPTILTARREMQSWRRLALEPSALRTSDRYVDPRAMDANGRHLPATLFRVALGDESTDPEGVYARVSGRLSDLAGVRVRSLRVQEDDTRELLTIQLREASGLELPARSLSEGTLRFLALCVLLEDPTVTGLICMEEPENGIHPANLEAMVRLVEDLAVDPTDAPGVDNPFRQVIINTHSPGIVQLARPDDLLFADTAIRAAPDGSNAHTLRLRPMAETWRAKQPNEMPVTKLDILPYLTTPPGVQISLESA